VMKPVYVNKMSYGESKRISSPLYTFLTNRAHEQTWVDSAGSDTASASR
jgi:hypothetical protein